MKYLLTARWHGRFVSHVGWPLEAPCCTEAAAELLFGGGSYWQCTQNNVPGRAIPTSIIGAFADRFGDLAPDLLVRLRAEEERQALTEQMAAAAKETAAAVAATAAAAETAEGTPAKKRRSGAGLSGVGYDRRCTLQLSIAALPTSHSARLIAFHRSMIAQVIRHMPPDPACECGLSL